MIGLGFNLGPPICSVGEGLFEGGCLSRDWVMRRLQPYWEDLTGRSKSLGVGACSVLKGTCEEASAGAEREGKRRRLVRSWGQMVLSLLQLP